MSAPSRRVLIILAFVLLDGLLAIHSAQAQTKGYIYLHKKALDESSSVNFSFSLTGGPSSFSTLTVNDKPDVIDSYDLGASHGESNDNSGNGQLWAVTGVANAGLPHTVAGIIYMRPAGSAAWVSTDQTGQNVDGAAYNQMVYTNATGNAYFYTYGSSANSSSANRIYNPANHSAVKLRDIAYGGGMTVVIDANGHLLKYTGTYANNNDSWTDLTSVSNLSTDISALDVVPSSQLIIVQTSTGNVYTLNNDGTNLVALPYPANASAPVHADVGVDDNGKIYAQFTETFQYKTAFIYTYDRTTNTWLFERQTRKLAGITGSAGSQMWASNTLGGAARTIYSRTTEGGANWIDDERVRTTVADNSVIIPVLPGTYDLTEMLPSGWDVNEIRTYDPTNNSTVNTASNIASLNVAAGEVIHVTFTNELIKITPISNSCSLQYVQNFGSGTTDFSNPFVGTTPYHYIASSQAQDGYYTLAKNANNWFQANTITADHTPDAIDGGNGYLLLVNASYGTDEFYRQRVSGLVVGQSYTMGFWCADISPRAVIRPNVTFGIANVNTGNFIGSVSTGPVNSTDWKQYQFTFTASSTTADVVFQNNSIGGEGNDIVIDDITLNAAAPAIAATNGPSVLCSNTGEKYTFTNQTAGGTWSVSPAALATIDATTGLLTPVSSASGVATVIYTVTSAGGCISTATKDITIGNTCAGAPVSISGNVFNDANGLSDNTVNGPGTNGGGLNVIVYNATTGRVQASMAVPTSGVYSFTGLPNGNDYSVVITTASATAGTVTSMPVVALPTNYTSTGENVGATAGNDGNVDGILHIGVLSASITNVNFGIEQLPTANNVTAASQPNPGGNTQVIVPTLTGSDPEDGSYTGSSLTNTLIIRTLPAASTGILYYNGVAVTVGQTILAYDPSLLSLDPAEGAVTPGFTYSEVDAAGKASPAATVSLIFTEVPDLTPIIYARPSTIYNTTAITVVVDVLELKGIASSGLITVKVTKDPLVSLSFPTGSMSVGGRTVQNGAWQYDGNSDPGYYIFTTNSSVPGGDQLSFGLEGTLTPGATAGNITVSTSIKGGSGGEIRLNNNMDSDKIDYFQQ